MNIEHSSYYCLCIDVSVETHQILFICRLFCSNPPNTRGQKDHRNLHLNFPVSQRSRPKGHNQTLFFSQIIYFISFMYQNEFQAQTPLKPLTQKEP